jgi:hypothetical protein
MPKSTTSTAKTQKIGTKKTAEVTKVTPKKKVTKKSK